MLIFIDHINPKPIIQTKLLKKYKYLIQTHGIKIKNSIVCTNSEQMEKKLKEIIMYENNINQITIFSLSTINVTQNIILLLKGLSIKGFEIVLVSYEDELLPYADYKV